MSKINTIKVIISVLILMVFIIFNTISCIKEAAPEQTISPEKVILTPSEDVSVTIITDEYVMPVAELKTTKTYPEIIKIENKYIKISIIPSRGRLIFDYLFKPTGSNEFYKNARPIAILKDNDYVVEFGGYYLSVPWNPRDRQPYDLEYKVTKEGPDIAEVYMWGEDPTNQAFVEVWVTVERDSSLVRLKTRIYNRSEKDINTHFNDYTVIAAGEELTDNSSFVIPTSEVTIGQSNNDWMGVEGDNVSWPQIWNKWGNFEHFGSFNVSADNMSGPFAAVINHDTGDTLVKLWEPDDFFDGIYIWSWGKDYADVSGGEPTVNYENYTELISIPSNKSIDFVTYFYTLKNMQDVAMADTVFAGWLKADKQLYEIDSDSTLKIQSQVGSSKDYENINLRVSLIDLDGNVLNDIFTEPITAVSPSEICNRFWEISFNDIKAKPGEYILKLEILDNNDFLLFTTSSLPIFIK